MIRIIKILSIALLVSVFGCNIKLFVDNNKYRQLLVQEEMKINNLVSVNKLYNDIVELDIKGNSNFQLPNFQIVPYPDSIAKNSSIYEYCMLHPNTLFFRFTDMQCATCYANELQLLSSFSDSTNIDVTLLVTYKQKRGLNMILKEYPNKFKCLLIDENAMKFILEDYYIPYYFKVNQELNIYSVFTPLLSNSFTV